MGYSRWDHAILTSQAGWTGRARGPRSTLGMRRHSTAQHSTYLAEAAKSIRFPPDPIPLIHLSEPPQFGIPPSRRLVSFDSDADIRRRHPTLNLPPHPPASDHPHTLIPTALDRAPDHHTQGVVEATSSFLHLGHEENPCRCFVSHSLISTTIPLHLPGPGLNLKFPTRLYFPVSCVVIARVSR